MDQAIRNKLRNVVTQCRRLLEEAVSQVLQGQFGIYATGKRDEVKVEDASRMGHLSDEGVTTRFQRMFRSKVIVAQRFRIIDLVSRGQESPQKRGPSLGSEEWSRGPETCSGSDPRNGR